MPLIAFVSPKGGVGKTTLAANVAALLAARRFDVLALDLDPQNALRLHLGLPITEEDGYMAELGGRTTWQSALRATPYGVQILPHGFVDPRRSLDLGRLLMNQPEVLTSAVREMLADPRRIVIVDSPPGPTPALTAVLPLADLMVVALLADGGSASLVPQIVSGRFLGRGTLAARAAERVGVVLNQVDLHSSLSVAVLDCVTAALGTRLLGVIARDDAVSEALADKRLPADDPESHAAADMHHLTDAICERLALFPPPERGGFSAFSEWGLRR